jgi:hypothetical protein
MYISSRDPSAGVKQHHNDSNIAASASRMFHRVTASLGSEKDKDQAAENKKDHLAALWTKKRTLCAQVKNLHIKVDIYHGIFFITTYVIIRLKFWNIGGAISTTLHRS